MSDPVFKLGILGLGEGVSILSAATRSELAVPHQLCDLNEDLCRQRCEQFGLSDYTTSYDEMLANPEIDGVAIYTPDPFHTEHVKMALAAGKHVICTKPLFKGLEGVREVWDLAQKQNKHVLVGQSCRFFETFQHQRRDFEAGKNGRLLSAEAHYNGDKRSGSSGGWGKKGAVYWMYTGMAHPVDLVYWYLGPIEEVMGYAVKSSAAVEQGQDHEDNYHFVMKSKEGIPGRVTGYYGTPGAHPAGEGMIACTLRGESGYTQADYPRFDYYTQLDGENPQNFDYSHKHAYYFRWGGSIHHAGEFQNYLEYFVTCLRSGENPRPDLADGIRVVATLEAMQQAVDSGAPVRVASILEQYHLGELA